MVSVAEYLHDPKLQHDFKLANQGHHLAATKILNNGTTIYYYLLHMHFVKAITPSNWIISENEPLLYNNDDEFTDQNDEFTDQNFDFTNYFEHSFYRSILNTRLVIFK